MNTSDLETGVVIVGGGVAGLSLANILLRNGISCIVLERCSREYVEQRQRAGSLDDDAVRILRAWGLDEVVEGQEHLGAAEAEGMPLKIDGETHYWKIANDEDEGVFCPQQVLVRNLIEVFLRDGGDLRFGVEGIQFDGVDGPRPLVRFRDADTATSIRCDVVAGCDGDRGASRAAMPPGVLTTHSLEHGYAWLSVLADVRADPPAVMAIHSRGFAAQITRGANVSRFYLQCPLTDTLEEWPDARIWSELESRFGEPLRATGRITDKQLVPIRSVVHSPMSHGRLYLLGDAAHLVSPMSAKGMSMALHDADALARAVIHQSETGDSKLLDAYSENCLRHVWDTQTSAVAITEVMHDSGDASYRGEFRKQLARTELWRMIDPAGMAQGNPF
jgi:p-hydroxybenzoate 3-monooxygenase